MSNDEVAFIIQNALESCTKEKNCNSVLVPLENVIERVSYYTGLSTTLIQKFSNDGNELRELDQLLLLQSIKALLVKYKQPTIKNVYAQYLKEGPKEGVSHFSMPLFIKLLNEIGYRYRKSSKNQLIIVEDPIRTFERYNYLKQIQRYRKNQEKTFYYIDSKVFAYENEVLATDEDMASKEYAHFFMISSTGYEHGLFTTEVTSKNFKNWIGDILLPMLKPSSVVVICNQQLLDRAKNITCYNTKTEMWQWLQDSNIPFDTSMRKAELFELIDKCTSKSKSHDIDRLLKSQGHVVLYLPPSFDISPTKIMYKYITNKIKIGLGNKLKIKQFVLNVIEAISNTKWANFTDTTIDTENHIFEIDAQIEYHYELISKTNDEYETRLVCNQCNLINLV